MRNKRKLIDPVEIGSKGGRARAERLSTFDLQESGRSVATPGDAAPSNRNRRSLVPRYNREPLKQIAPVREVVIP
jgi:hypothetical protein